MSSITAPQIRVMARGETHRIDIDWGDSTAGAETGVLNAGDLVESCVVEIDARPGSAVEEDDPELGTVVVPENTSSDTINSRQWVEGEATTCTIETADDQTLGTYRLKFTATTVNGMVLPRFITVQVKAH